MATEFSPKSRMVDRTSDFQKRTSSYIWIAFAVTLLMHLLGFGWVLYSGYLQMPEPRDKVAIVPYEKFPEREELALDIMNEPKELVDVPDRLSVPDPPQEDTPRIADKNAMSRNPVESENLPEDDPFSKGLQREITVMNDPAAVAQHSDPSGGARILTPRVGGVRDFKQTDEIPLWNPDMLLKQEYRDGKGREDRDRELDLAEAPDLVDRDLVVVPLDDLDMRPDRHKATYERHKSFDFTIGPGRLNPSYENKFSLARDFGDFSFSTVAWDYAPYLYELRERIRRHWYPPPAFRMGLLSGRVKVNFKIFPDGHLEDFQFLSRREQYDEGYQSLKKSSQNAILASLPFFPLPYDFPDPFLEITGTFYYQIIGEDQ